MALIRCGFMLDVSRHFAPVPEVLRWIELLAMHRLNRLHLHLTDREKGWRRIANQPPVMADDPESAYKIGRMLAFNNQIQAFKRFGILPTIKNLRKPSTLIRITSRRLRPQRQSRLT